MCICSCKVNTPSILETPFEHDMCVIKNRYDCLHTLNIGVTFYNNSTSIKECIYILDNKCYR